MPENIFDQNDSIVDKDTDCQTQRHERHIIQRKVHRLHQKEGGNDRSRYGQTADDRRPKIAQEHISYQKCQESAKKNGVPDIGNVLADIGRLVADDIDFDILRQVIGYHLFHRSVDAVDNIDCVGFRLLAHQHHNAGDLVGAGISLFIFPAVNNLYNVCQLDRTPILISYDDVFDVVDIFIFSQRSDRYFHIVITGLAAWGIDIFTVDLV